MRVQRHRVARKSKMPHLRTSEGAEEACQRVRDRQQRRYLSAFVATGLSNAVHGRVLHVAFCFVDIFGFLCSPIASRPLLLEAYSRYAKFAS
jgi:hypothetical protein